MGLWAKRPLDSSQVGQLRNHLSPWSQLGVGLRGGSLKGKRRLLFPFLPFSNCFLKVKGQDPLSSHEGQLGLWGWGKWETEGMAGESCWSGIIWGGSGEEGFTSSLRECPAFSPASQHCRQKTVGLGQRSNDSSLSPLSSYPLTPAAVARGSP